jgi:hypothetical protein
MPPFSKRLDVPLTGWQRKSTARRRAPPAHPPLSGKRAIEQKMKKNFGFATALAAAVFTLSGCDGFSASDKQFVAASMPTSFESFRMYNEEGGATAGRQACLAMIHTPVGVAQEHVVLERGSGMTFSISAARDGLNWDVSSDGGAPTDGNSAVFRYLVVACVSTLEDKFLAEATDKVARPSLLHR